MFHPIQVFVWILLYHIAKNNTAGLFLNQYMKTMCMFSELNY